MATAFRPRTLVLFLGDLVSFVLALWLSLFLRTLEAPTREFLFAHLVPFSLLFVAWIIVFFIGGLYENRSIILARRAFSAALLIAQTVNLVIAALFFFFVPLFGIAPKTVLFIYLPVSFVLVLLWRIYVFPRLGLQVPESAIVVGEGKEVDELVDALRRAHRAPAIVREVVPASADLPGAVVEAMTRHQARVIIADFTDPRVSTGFPHIYNPISIGVRFFDAMTVYEEVFGRIPLSVLDDRWVARNVSQYERAIYDPLKRLMDIAAALLLGLVALVLSPFFALIIKLQDRGPVLYHQTRVGQNNTSIRMSKFRSMSGTDQGAEVLKSRHTVTAFGKVLRVSRLDELPQLWSVLRGDLSLIGPRPEFPALVGEYTKAIPYYNLRHLVKPGLSGWAQLYHDNHPHHGTDIEATREKLSYDLYYLKHRSLMLDATIALKTIKKLLTRSGV